MMTSPAARSLVAIVPRRALLLLLLFPFFTLRLFFFFFLFVFVEVGSAPAGASATRPTRTSECPPEARIQSMRAEPVRSSPSSSLELLLSCCLHVVERRGEMRSRRRRRKKKKVGSDRWVFLAIDLRERAKLCGERRGPRAEAASRCKGRLRRRLQEPPNRDVE